MMSLKITNNTASTDIRRSFQASSTEKPARGTAPKPSGISTSSDTDEVFLSADAGQLQKSTNAAENELSPNLADIQENTTSSETAMKNAHGAAELADLTTKQIMARPEAALLSQVSNLNVQALSPFIG
jgi:hypothetical protein